MVSRDFEGEAELDNEFWRKMLAVVLNKHGIRETEIVPSDVDALIERDHCVVLGPHPDPNVIRMRLMTQEAADAIEKAEER